MEADARIVLFSHLDGTRFDPYLDATGVTPSMCLPLVRERIPIVFFSSRTRAELELIQQQFGIRQPFVAEGGGAVYVPRGYFAFHVPGARDVAGYQVVSYGRPYADVVGALRLTARQLGISVVGFNDMSVSDVAAECGLTLLQARLAKLRDHSEPFRIADLDADALPRLVMALGASKLRCVDTDRYMQVGANVDQDAIMALLISLYRHACPAALMVGIGDPVTDHPMLQRMDVPVAEATLARQQPISEARTTGSALNDGRRTTLLDILETARARLNSWRQDERR